MIHNILGIDLGTSSVKLILGREGDAEYTKSKGRYFSPSIENWWDAICTATKSMDLSHVRAVGLSSQVGTYIVDDGRAVISWNDGVGAIETEKLLCDIDRDIFIREISMPHPRVISYPLPRLKYILSHYDSVKKVCMPKDKICQLLTGNLVTDKFSWRGLANLDTGEYSKALLSHIGAENTELPRIISPTDIAGYVTKEASLATGIPEGTPVYVGCNDFFSGTLGMGMIEVGDMFDITGTSEHIGIIEKDIRSTDDGLVAGGYFFDNVHYGVTASSGPSMDFGFTLHDLGSIDVFRALDNHAPVFLPYLCGERAPIWDADARGVFFGINKNTTKHDMAYAVMEGVAFSIYHIYKCMGSPTANTITVAGGAGKDPVLNLMKASLFDLPLRVSSESDTSALGAVILASVGTGDYPDIQNAISQNCTYSQTTLPDKALGERLRARFDIYESLYPALKNSFKKLK